MEQAKREEGPTIRSLEDVIGVIIPRPREGARGDSDWIRGTIPEGTLLFHATMNAFSETHIRRLLSYFSTNLVHPSARFFERMTDSNVLHPRPGTYLNPRVIVYRTTRDITVYGSNYYHFDEDMEGLPKDAEGVWKTLIWEEIVSVSKSFADSLEVAHIMNASIVSLRWLARLLNGSKDMLPDVLVWDPPTRPPDPRDVKGARAILEVSKDLDLQYRTAMAFSSQGISEGVTLSMFAATFNSNLAVRNKEKLIYNYRWVDPDDDSVKALACMWYFPPGTYEKGYIVIAGVEHVKGYNQCRKEFMRSIASWEPTTLCDIVLPSWGKLYVKDRSRIVERRIKDTHFNLKEGRLTMSRLEGYTIKDVYRKNL